MRGSNEKTQIQIFTARLVFLVYRYRNACSFVTTITLMLLTMVALYCEYLKFARGSYSFSIRLNIKNI